MESRSIEVNGINMRWEEAGSGRPTVLIHGIPTCPRLWRDVVPRLDGARCLAWEMVGYGASIPAGRDRDISVGKQADYLVDWLRAIGVERAVLVGHDLGGGVAQIAAVRHPEMVEGLVLMNAIAYDSWPIPSVKALSLLGPLVRRFNDAVASRIIRLFMLRGHATSRQARDAYNEHWPHYARHDGAAAFVRQVQALDVEDTLAIADRLPALNIPTRLVWGAADPFQPIGYGYRLAYELKGTIERIENGKHFVPEDHPDRVANTINQLLADLRQDTGASRAVGA